MRTLCLVATAVFAVFTYWQFNDLEQYGTRLWLGWVFAYGSVAVVSAVSWRRPLPRSLYGAGAVAAALAAAIRMTDIVWDGPILYNESNPAGNETGGLLIVGVWLTLLAYRAADRAVINVDAR